MRKSREIGQNSEDIRTEVENVVKSISINSNSTKKSNQVTFAENVRILELILEH